MRNHAFIAALFALCSILFSCLAIGLVQWVGGDQGSDGVGLWGERNNGEFKTWSQLLAENPSSKRLQQYETAGNVGAAFGIIGVVLMTVACVVQLMKACKESLPFPQHQLNDEFKTKLFSALGLYCASFGALSLWSSWALWASCRVYGTVGQAGWCILFIVLGFLSGGASAIFFAIEKSQEERYALLKDANEKHDLHSDWNVPPYAWTLKSFVNYNTWNAPALSKTLFYLSLLVIFIKYLDYTTTFEVASPKDLWTRIVVGLVFFAIAVIIARIICEMILVVFVFKDRYVGKEIVRPAEQNHNNNRNNHDNNNDNNNDNSSNQEQQQPGEGGGYQAI